MKRQPKTKQLKQKPMLIPRRTKSFTSQAEFSEKIPRQSLSLRGPEMKLLVQTMRMMFSQSGSMRSGTRQSLPHNSLTLSRRSLIFTSRLATRSHNSNRNFQVPRLKLPPRKKPSVKLKKMLRKPRSRREPRPRKERKVRRPQSRKNQPLLSRPDKKRRENRLSST